MPYLFRLSRLVVSAALLLALTSTATAQSVDRAVDKGIAAYNDLEYEKAAKLLAKALANPKDGSAEKVKEGFQTLALSYLALKKHAEVKKTFLRLLEFDDSYELPATVSEEAFKIFEEAQAEIEARQQKPDPVKLSLEHSVTPTTPSPGSAIDFTVTLSTEAPIETMTLHHRVRGTESFSSVRGARDGAAFKLTLSGAFVKAPGVEYYIVAEDKSGAVWASIASETEPLALLTEAIVAPTGSPFYKKWWFWTAVGGTVATAVVLGLVLSSGSDTGSNVTISVNPPPMAAR
jgi:tetratricopeptide (TPR) repeat protein